MVTRLNGRDADVVVIGSSPLLLLAASHAARAGRRVLLIEERPTLGGAWACSKWDGHEGVELGSHYLYCTPRAYGYLASLGVRLAPMVPRPIAIRNGRRLPLWTSHKADRLAEAVRDRSAADIRHQLTRLLTYGSYLYPEAGAAGLISDLVANATIAGVTIRTGRRVVSVDADPGSVVCLLDDGSTASSAQLVAGESVRVESYAVDGTTHRPTHRATAKTHVIVRLLSTDCAPLTYVEVSGHDAIRRVSLAVRPSGLDTVWAVEVPARGTDVELVMDGLSRLGLLRPAAQLLGAKTVRYRGSFWPPEDRKALAAFGSTVTVLPTWICFGDSLVSWLRGSRTAF